MCAIRYTNIAEIKIRRYKREKNAQIKNTLNFLQYSRILTGVIIRSQNPVQKAGISLIRFPGFPGQYPEQKKTAHRMFPLL